MRSLIWCCSAMRIDMAIRYGTCSLLLSTIAYGIMIIIWICYILQPQRIAQPVRVIPYNDIAKWNEKLEELLKRKAA